MAIAVSIRDVTTSSKFRWAIVGIVVSIAVLVALVNLSRSRRVTSAGAGRMVDLQIFNSTDKAISRIRFGDQSNQEQVVMIAPRSLRLVPVPNAQFISGSNEKMTCYFSDGSSCSGAFSNVTCPPDTIVSFAEVAVFDHHTHLKVKMTQPPRSIWNTLFP